MEVHIVHYKTEYGCFEEAEKYLDGVCVIAVFLKVIIVESRLPLNRLIFTTLPIKMIQQKIPVFLLNIIFFI